MAWILDHLDDLASDLSAVHGIRDMSQLSGAALCKLAYRLSAYPSVAQARYAEQVRDQPEQGSGPAMPQHGGQQRQMVPATKAALQADPVMSQMFSFSSPKPE